METKSTTKNVQLLLGAEEILRLFPFLVQTSILPLVQKLSERRGALEKPGVASSGSRRLITSTVSPKFLRVREKHATLALESNASESSDISTKAMGEVLRKYDKVHGSINNLKCSTKCQNVQLEDLKNPCLCELMAWHINVKEKKNKPTIPGPLDDCKLQKSEGRFSISASLSNSRVLDVDLTCSICLEALFDPVSLACSHMFCYMCACSAGSVSTIDGIKAADSKSKCPLCRKKGVFSGAMRMSELSILLRRKLPEYWDERRQKERKARLEEAKEYWQLQCGAFVGIN